MRPETRENWELALSSEAVRDRWAAKVVLVPGSECLWWVGAISGRGHGRFWVGPDHVVIAHRFAFAMTHGTLEASPLLGHRCDNPLCQRIGDDHVVVSTARKNRREWVQRRDNVDSPLAERRTKSVEAAGQMLRECSVYHRPGPPGTVLSVQSFGA